MSSFWSSLVDRLTPYIPGEQPEDNGSIKLNTNENPYGPSLKVLKAIADASDDRLRLYPEPESDSLKEAFAAYHVISPRQVFVGNGSDEVLAHAFQALLKHKAPVLFPNFSYSFYKSYCGLYEIEYEQVLLTDEFEIRIEDYIKPNGGIIFPNPNAPTGRLLSLDLIKALLDKNTNSVVVVDEAYIDFGGVSAITLIDSYPNLLVVQTLSKSRSLAGLRVGFAAGDPGLIEALTRVKNSFNSYPLDRLATAGAIAALEDDEHFRSNRQRIIDSRAKLSTDLMILGFYVLPSAANFLFAHHPDHYAVDIAARLRENDIIVRRFDTPGIENYLRITIGKREECAKLVTTLNAIL